MRRNQHPRCRDIERSIILFLTSFQLLACLPESPSLRLNGISVQCLYQIAPLEAFTPVLQASTQDNPTDPTQREVEVSVDVEALQPVSSDPLCDRPRGVRIPDGQLLVSIVDPLSDQIIFQKTFSTSNGPIRFSIKTDHTDLVASASFVSFDLTSENSSGSTTSLDGQRYITYAIDPTLPTQVVSETYRDGAACRYELVGLDGVAQWENFDVSVRITEIQRTYRQGENLHPRCRSLIEGYGVRFRYRLSGNDVLSFLTAYIFGGVPWSEGMEAVVSAASMFGDPYIEEPTTLSAQIPVVRVDL